MKLQKEIGQTLLIVVLIMVVVLTVGLSVASRSIVNLRTSVEEENSQRAFSAAEAGIERVLKTNLEITAQNAIDLGNNSKIKQVTIGQVLGTQLLVNGGNPIIKDDGADIWLVDHNLDDTINYSSGWQLLSGDSKITVYWGTSADSCSNAAIEIVAISGRENSLLSNRYALDPCSDRRVGNNFSNPESGNYTSSGRSFFYRTTIDVRNSSKGIMIRIIPIYSNTPIAIKGCNKDIDSSGASCTAFPSQGKQIESTGTSGTTTRKVTLFQGYQSLPSEFFQYVIFCTKQSDSGCSGL